MREINLNKQLTSPIQIGDVEIFEHPDDGITFVLEGKHKLCESMPYISGYARALPKLMEAQPKKILVTGLGLGLIPKYLEDNYSDIIIDVIERNQNVIDAATQLGHLNITNFIKGDMWMFAADKKYDLIINDIFWDVSPTFPHPDTIWHGLKDKLSVMGVIYTPMADYIMQ